MKNYKTLIESSQTAQEIFEATNAKIGDVTFGPDLIKRLTAAGLKPASGPYTFPGSYKYTKGDAEVVVYPSGKANDAGVEAYQYGNGQGFTAQWADKAIPKGLKNIKKIIKAATISADQQAFEDNMKALGASQVGY